MNAWTKVALKKINDHQAVWLTIYNIKTNTVWFAAGFIIGSIGIAYIEKNKTDLYKKTMSSE